MLKLLEKEDEVAGVLGHEIGHVVGRHSNEQMAKAQLSQGLVNAVVMAGGNEYGMTAGQLAQFVSQLKNTAYGRDDELESDQLGVRFMIRAGYDPEALIRVMEVLKKRPAAALRPSSLAHTPIPTIASSGSKKRSRRRNPRILKAPEPKIVGTGNQRFGVLLSVLARESDR